MFFSGDTSTRKRVDLGGRSSKERDRQVLLEEARLERKRRSELRQKTAAAIEIQVSDLDAGLCCVFVVVELGMVGCNP